LYKLEVLQAPYLTSDLEEIWNINQENIPEVGDVPNLDRLKKLIDWSSHLIVVRDYDISGFIILMREGQNYDSLNYKFFNSQSFPFLYVDRIAIKDGHRRKGLGRMIYEKTIDIAKDLDVSTCCEVNTIPRNDPSLAFHDTFGFREVGTKDYDDHSVVYLTKTSS
jgi:predicted GNAT superfamily acetyltransferase